ncbi:hypothetical protein OG887_26025 [Streptomyces sp. NBC_00053]|uniref:hypothetical protein n=1 Tax=unclassified Streptomyces TaxID=2593676 RepID=UPI000F5BA798|nr:MULTISPECIES: hypothetical protein [unclassified Streptomyces]WSG53003.1 hypothetical protein OHA38_26260 [Streptomyces sp. NBC_01732]WSX03646.1 hypothetical protein OG355_26315 [Streptomyces sp. NBC_00987]MCX4394338.1 hypothetical protein [Streptomyces sp. NBC_01767]MCX5106287.1 hypothetical protein [Streptomyces sp. NBC_00439]MCX5162575.1 hypothetical protein [Streptomyces sp. NBC_00305]
MNDALDRALLREDLAYHQTRVLILVTSVAGTTGHSGKLDGLTKLAKLDFLLRYPALASTVLDLLDPRDQRLALAPEELAAPTEVEAPMTRYKYGPWDDRYYAVIGALVGRGLLRYAKGRRGSVALVPTPSGKRLVADLAATEAWAVIKERSDAVAEASADMTGNTLKDLIYERLADLMNRPHREVIQ